MRNDESWTSLRRYLPVTGVPVPATRLICSCTDLCAIAGRGLKVIVYSCICVHSIRSVIF